MSIHTTDCTSCSEIQNAIRKQIIALSNTVSSQSQLGTNHMSNPAPVSNSVPAPSPAPLILTVVKPGNNVQPEILTNANVIVTDATLNAVVCDIIKKAILQTMNVSVNGLPPALPPALPLTVSGPGPGPVVTATGTGAGAGDAVLTNQAQLTTNTMSDAAEAVLKLIDMARSLPPTPIIHTLTMLAEYLGKTYSNTRPTVCRPKMEFISELQRVSGKLAGNCATAHCCVVLTIVYNEISK